MRAILLAAALLVSGAVFGQASEIVRPDARVEERLKLLAEELRCLVCQNQTLADSNAPLAVDLRNQIREQISAGASEREVVDFMVARYGDFVLYRPPVTTRTWLLWAAPALLVLGGVAVVVAVVRGRARAARDPARLDEEPDSP